MTTQAGTTRTADTEQKRVHSKRRYQIRFAAVIIVAALAACGKGGEKATQVAAKVNGDEITVHQVNQAAQRLGNVPEGQAKQVQKQILDRLIDQQLLVQQAIDKKLDRDPRVVASIEAAKRQILAQAYVDQVTGGAQKASGDQVTEFYDQHPELFKERRVYRFTQLAIAVSPDKQPELRSKLEELDKQADKAKVLPQLVEWLKSQNLQYRVNQVTQAAEQLPLEALPKYQKMNVGDLIFNGGPQGAVIAQIAAAQTQPLTKEQAQPFIEQYLQNRDKLKLGEDEMKRLRTAAKIEYVGEFAQLQQETPAKTGAPEKTETPAPPTPAAPAAGQSGTDQDAVSKGIKGLK